VFYVAYMFLL